MDETRRLDLRPLVAVLAVAFVAATIWAAVALAAGGSSPAPSSGSSGDDSPGQFIQTQDDSEAPPEDDCPDRDGGSGGGSGDGAGSDGSGSSDL
jgi:hypothetical protein